MKFSERGITVGDLLLILIFVFSTVFIINKVKEKDNQTQFITNPNELLIVKKY